MVLERFRQHMHADIGGILIYLCLIILFGASYIVAIGLNWWLLGIIILLLLVFFSFWFSYIAMAGYIAVVIMYFNAKDLTSLALLGLSWILLLFLFQMSHSQFTQTNFLSLILTSSPLLIILYNFHFINSDFRLFELYQPHALFILFLLSLFLIVLTYDIFMMFSARQQRA
ncbi:MAG: hypothetical protein KKG59_01805 [Nanoarchaeota archaeon]|nr:hypothetical protein [Nanoarchaeota archaeon]